MDDEEFDLSEIVNSRLSVRSRFKEIAQHNVNTNNVSNLDNDTYLSDLLKVLKIKSMVIGVGGAGNSTVSRMQDMDTELVETLNINTDAHDLYYSNSNQKLLIGKETCSGLGSGNDPNIGTAAAEEDVDRLSQVLNADVVFLTFGLGGGTGTGAAPIIAREAKKNNATVVSFCSVPFSSEGTERSLRARKGLEELMKYSDTLIPIPNNNLLRFNQNLPVLAGFKIMDEVLIRSIKEIINLINNCGLINIDYADVRKVLEKKGNYPSGLIGITESLGEEADLIKKAKLALHNPLLEPDTKKVDKCIVSVSGDHQLSLSKLDRIISTISSEIPEDASLKFGTSLNPALGSKIRIMALGRGPISPYVQAAINGTEFPHSHIGHL
ncbi:MAG: cell division FtsZ family protein [Candidatus Lokiarchaeota archaeon]|jgi:cell division protein FtsZ|nr:cell division FtsZ family protein [Candidatus Lokiarchaeota archaeon]